MLSQTRAIDDQFARAQTTIAGAFQVLENSATTGDRQLDSNSRGVQGFYGSHGFPVEVA
ncbi:hypothetical protein ACNUI4_32380 [Pseudomonas aeruginosa]